MKHAGAGAPSNLGLTVKCPGWVRFYARHHGFAFRKLQEFNEWFDTHGEEAGAAAREGTRAHKHLEAKLRHLYFNEPFPELPTIEERSENNVRYAFGVIGKLYQQLKTTEKEVVLLITEGKVQYSPLIWGTCDVQMHTTNHCVVIDFKNGSFVGHEALNNWQLMAYWMAAHMNSKQRPTLGIIQPSHPQPSACQSFWHPHPVDLYDMMTGAEQALEEAERMNVGVKAGAHCDTYFCSNRKYCGAYIEANQPSEKEQQLALQYRELLREKRYESAKSTTSTPE